MFRNLLFGLLGLTMLAACKSHPYKSDNLPDTVLIFGNGGGIMGVANTYYLCENGQIFFRKGVADTYSELPHVGKKKARAAFAACDSLHLQDMKLDAPGNVYYFIEKRSGGSSHKITWGDPKQTVGDDLKRTFRQLNDLVSETKN